MSRGWADLARLRFYFLRHIGAGFEALGRALLPVRDGVPEGRDFGKPRTKSVAGNQYKNLITPCRAPRGME